MGIPIIKTWKSIFDFESNELVAQGFNTRFPLIYEATKHGLPSGVTFSPLDFICSIQGTTRDTKALLTNVDDPSKTPIHLQTNSDIDNSQIWVCY